MFKNMKLAQKMILGFALLIIVAVIMAVVGYNGLRVLMADADIIGKVKLPSIQSLLEIEGAKSYMLCAERGFLNNRFFLDEEKRKIMHQDLETAWKKLDTSKKVYESQPHTDAEVRAWKKFASEFDEWKKSHDRFYDFVLEKERLINRGVDPNSKAVTDIDDKMFEINDAAFKYWRSTSEIIDELVRENDLEAKQAIKHVQEIYNSSIRMLLATLVVGMLFAIGLSAFLSGNIAGILKNLLEEARKLTEAAIDGRLAVRADAEKIDLEFRPIVDGVNKTLDAVIGPLNVAAEYVDRISKGDIPPKITDTYKGDFNEIKNNLNVCIDSLNGLVDEMNKMAREHNAGDIDVAIHVDKFGGSYKQMAQGINEMVFSHISVKKKAMACVAEFGRGNFDAPIEKFPGKKAFINDTIEAVRGNLKAIAGEISTLIEAAKEGVLSKRGNGNNFAGDWKKLVMGVNDILDSVIMPINEAADVLKEMAKGNLDVSVAGNYKGDHAMIKNTLNATLESINEILGQVSLAVEQVTSGANQVSSSSQTLSQASSESASSLEEITSSMEEFTSQTKQNAENAAQANQLASAARVSAQKGNTQMTEMLDAMKAINDSAKNVSKIMKAIDEIAFQTNILALNAAVEAARAGRHGKGFTVVAEEVRNLAQRSAKAAAETADLIENSIAKTDGGTKIAEDTSKSLSEIVVSATKVTDLIGEIAAASKEQTGGIGEINQGLSQLEQVTQQNSATSEESAAASEELSSQALHLKSMIAKFKLKQAAGAISFAGAMQHQGAVTTLHARQALAKTQPNAGQKAVKKPETKAKYDKAINLDDKDFDKF